MKKVLITLFTVLILIFSLPLDPFNILYSLTTSKQSYPIHIFLLCLIVTLLYNSLSNYYITLTKQEYKETVTVFNSNAQNFIFILLVYQNIINSLKVFPILVVIFVLKIQVWALNARIKSGVEPKYSTYCYILLASCTTLLYTIYKISDNITHHFYYVTFALEIILTEISILKLLYFIKLNKTNSLESNNLRDNLLLFFVALLKHLNYIIYTLITIKFNKFPHNSINDIMKSHIYLKKKYLGVKALYLFGDLLKGSENIIGECLICTDEGKCGLLECGHYFHEECLRRWVTQQQVCPVCRKELFKGAGFLKILCRDFLFYISNSNLFSSGSNINSSNNSNITNNNAVN